MIGVIILKLCFCGYSRSIHFAIAITVHIAASGICRSVGAIGANGNYD